MSALQHLAALLAQGNRAAERPVDTGLPVATTLFGTPAAALKAASSGAETASDPAAVASVPAAALPTVEASSSASPSTPASASASSAVGAAATASASAIEVLDATIAFLMLRVKAAASSAVPADAQRAALAAFWQTGRVDSVRDARLIAFGLATPIDTADMANDAAPTGVALAPDAPHAAHAPDSTSHESPPELRRRTSTILDDASRLKAFLRSLDTWRLDPRRFRRCYQGLVHSYFAFDGQAPEASLAAHDNWEWLRLYLAARLRDIATEGTDPDWVTTAQANAPLFGAAPAEPYAGAALRGDTAALELVQARLGISSSSWFIREILLTQLREAGKLADAAFVAVLDRLLEMLGKNPLLRDRGVAMLLDRYAQCARPALHRGLYNAAILCWGNPWSNPDDPRWKRLSEAARLLVGDWLKPELIDAFFAAMSDSAGEGARRAAFWKRHAVGMDRLQWVLPASSLARLGTRPTDPPLLRRKLDGSVVPLIEGDPAGAALLMRFGPVLLVEFARGSLGAHGYSDSARLPFDLAAPSTSADPAPNSLRHPSRSLSLQHRDHQQGWATWEAMFDATLKRQYGIEPGVRRAAQVARHVDLAVAESAAPVIDLAIAGERGADWDAPAQAGLSAHWQTAEAGAVEFGRAELAIFARVHSLRVEDDSRSGGGVRVLTDDADEGVAWVLKRWGFVYGDGRWEREQGYR